VIILEYDPGALEQKLQDKDTPYIVIYPDAGVDIVGFTQDLRALLNEYHTRGQGWTIGSNIELDGIPLIEVASEAYEASEGGYTLRSYSFPAHPGI
jgi:hypothetical protein